VGDWYLANAKASLLSLDQNLGIHKGALGADGYRIEHMLVEELEGTVDILHIQAEYAVQRQAPGLRICAAHPRVLSGRAIAGDDVILAHPGHQADDFLGIELQICIGEEDQVPLCGPEPGPQRGAIALVRSMTNQPNPDVRVGSNRCCSPIHRAIIYDDHLPVDELTILHQGIERRLSRTDAA